MELILREDAIRAIARNLCRMQGFPEGAMVGVARMWLEKVPAVGDVNVCAKAKDGGPGDVDISMKVNGIDDAGRKAEQFLVELKKARSILKELAEILETLQVNVE